jgi:uncharacterized protein
MVQNAILAGTSFIEARVAHARLRPKDNRFAYRVPYLALGESALGGGRAGVLSVDRGNLFSVRTKDYGADGMTGVAFVRDVLQRWQMRDADGELVLVTMPRMLGFAFNPVSFWLCLDKARALRAVVAEVNNTFGERHFYVCRHADHRPIVPQDTVVADKVFHVSPFMPVDGHYRFAFSWTEGGFGARIDLYDGEGVILTTSMSGKREPVSSWRLIAALAGNPLLMFKVLGLIHYQAVRLWAKGIRHFRKPEPPSERVTG